MTTKGRLIFLSYLKENLFRSTASNRELCQCTREVFIIRQTEREDLLRNLRHE